MVPWTSCSLLGMSVVIRLHDRRRLHRKGYECLQAMVTISRQRIVLSRWRCCSPIVRDTGAEMARPLYCSGLGETPNDGCAPRAKQFNCPDFSRLPPVPDSWRFSAYGRERKRSARRKAR